MKKNIESAKGITLISLIITIIVLIILASIFTYSGISIIKSLRLTTFTTELKIMQTEIDSLYDKYKNGETIKVGNDEYTGSQILKIRKTSTDSSISTDIENSSLPAYTQAEKVFTANASGIENKDGYLYFNKKMIEDLHIEGVDQEFFVNIEKRSVVSYEGFKYEGKVYYTLDQLPNSVYNVEYNNPNSGKPTFDASIEDIGDNKWRITISNIQYSDGYIDKWQVVYQAQGWTYWNTIEDMNFVVDTPGKYKLKIKNGEIESDMQIISLGSWYDDTAKVNTPNLKQDMVPVYWDDSHQEKELTASSSEEEWNNWYSYVAGDNNTDSKDSRWANAKTSDGSYWVWIPRYEYKVTAAPSTTASETNAGKIDLKFISKTQTTADAGYTIHPAFTTDVNNGGWDSELDGIWVAKYEMSMEKDGTATTTVDSSSGNVSISNMVKMVSKPNVSSWRYINIANSYTNSYNYDRKKESHLIKNSEWGAVAYLAHSQYGRNGHEVTINNSSSFITGNAGESVSASGASGIINAYNTEKGMLASTTGNIYGIYDFNGGAWERTATFNNAYSGDHFTGTDYLDTEGNHFATTGGESTKYATAYSNATSIYQDDFTVGTVSMTGDSIQEVYVNNGNGWFDDYCHYVRGNIGFFYRGGYFEAGSNSGIFSSGRSSGDAYPNGSFRVVLAF